MIPTSIECWYLIAMFIKGTELPNLRMATREYLRSVCTARKNFPHRKQVSDLDFPIAKGAQDEEYLETVEQALDLAIRLASPDAVIYDAGVDIHADDDLGHLAISTLGVYQRDMLVLSRCEEAKLPVMSVIGGGYQRDIAALVDVHIQLFRAAGVCA